MDDIFGALSLVILACGIYCIYAYIKMKKTGEINEVLLLGKGQPQYACKNKEEFLAKAQPLVLIFAIATTLYGVIDAVNYYIMPLGIIDTIVGIVFFIVLVYFMVVSTKLKKKYFNL